MLRSQKLWPSAKRKCLQTGYNKCKLGMIRKYRWEIGWVWTGENSATNKALNTVLQGENLWDRESVVFLMGILGLCFGGLYGRGWALANWRVHDVIGCITYALRASKCCSHCGALPDVCAGMHFEKWKSHLYKDTKRWSKNVLYWAWLKPQRCQVQPHRRVLPPEPWVLLSGAVCAEGLIQRFSVVGGWALRSSPSIQKTYLGCAGMNWFAAGEHQGTNSVQFPPFFTLFWKVTTASSAAAALFLRHSSCYRLRCL